MENICARQHKNAKEIRVSNEKTMIASEVTMFSTKRTQQCDNKTKDFLFPSMSHQ